MSTVDISRYEYKGKPMKSQYSGSCAIDPDHDIKRGALIARVRLRDNRLVVLPGWACSACIRDMPRGRD